MMPSAAAGGFWFGKGGVYMTLQCKHITVTHTKDLRVLIDDFSFSLSPGEKIAMIGEEGNGKSTLLRVMAG